MKPTKSDECDNSLNATGVQIDHVNLRPKQILALPLLAAGKSLTEVAAELDVSRQTVSEWNNHDHKFIHALQLFQSETLRTARRGIETAAIDAVGELRKLLVNGASESVRLRAIELTLKAAGLAENKNHLENVDESALDFTAFQTHNDEQRPIWDVMLQVAQEIREEDFNTVDSD